MHEICICIVWTCHPQTRPHPNLPSGTDTPPYMRIFGGEIDVSPRGRVNSGHSRRIADILSLRLPTNSDPKSPVSAPAPNHPPKPHSRPLRGSDVLRPLSLSLTKIPALQPAIPVSMLIVHSH